VTRPSAALGLALLAAPGLALAQSPSPPPTGNVPHVRPAPSGTPLHRFTPRPGHPSPHPSSHASRPNQGRTSQAPYSARVILTGDDVQKILSASPSPSAKPTLGPPKTSFPEPDVFHDTHN
jgi:hypothetical protein